MTIDALFKILRARLAQAGLPPKINWHDFRRTLITNLIDVSGLEVTCKFVVHANTLVTAEYDRRVEKRAREAVT
jgi:hypothetical protein